MTRDPPATFDSWLTDDTPQRVARRLGRIECDEDAAQAPDPEPDGDEPPDPDTDDKVL